MTPDEAAVERVARAIIRERHRECCTGAALEDVCSLPLDQYDIAVARAALAAAPAPGDAWRDAAVRLARAMVSSGTECSMCGANFVFGESHAAECEVPIILDDPASRRAQGAGA